MKILISLLVLGVLIFIHEFGHFIIAKLTGVKVDDFSIGFGPKILGFKRGETEYNWRVLPFGGYCLMAGMDASDEEACQSKNAFVNKTVAQRMAVISAGPLMNFLLAILLFAAVFLFYGVTTGATAEIGAVADGKPAAEAGLQSGDIVKAIDGKEISDWTTMVEIIHANPEVSLQFTVERDGESFITEIIPYEDETGQGMIGIEAGAVITEKENPWTALKHGVEYTGELTMMIITYLGRMITGQAAVDLGGPVMIVSEIGKAASFGWASIAQLAAYLSINLGLLNLLPIPALDGSRLIFLGIEGIKGSPVNPQKENIVNFAGFVFLMLLMILVTYHDIISLL